MMALCTLCRRMFSGPGTGAIHDTPGQDAAARFLVKLAEHFRESHPDTDDQVEVSTLQYRGYLMMGYYRVRDADQYPQERERTRHSLHSSTRKVVITNGELRVIAQQMTAELDLDISASQDQAENSIYAALVKLRDRLCETEPVPAKLTV